ncbi:helix-turn-helix domain-containing protein [Nocardiopsis sediminis]|uniref:Helix-turn-helix domain-containing protein n=1 Tax=Nocardiopsis sediminis TaxID=1778267 RepID=A0ABV8FPB3_9ACTN
MFDTSQARTAARSVAAPSPMRPLPPNAIHPEEVARILHLAPCTVRAKALKGHIPTEQAPDGRRWFDREAIFRLAADLEALTTESDDLLWVGEAADLAWVDTIDIRRWADQGVLPVVRSPASSLRRYRRSDVMRVAAVHPGPTAVAPTAIDEVSTGEAAEIAGVTIATIRRWAVSGALPGVGIPGQTPRCYRESDLAGIVSRRLETRVTAEGTRDDTYTVAEAARILAAGESVIRRWVHNGVLPVRSLYRRFRIVADAVHELEAQWLAPATPTATGRPWVVPDMGVEEAARLLGRSSSFVHRVANQGIIRSIRWPLTHTRRFYSAEIRAMAERADEERRGPDART